MKVINMAGLQVVSVGMKWTYASSPCSKQAVQFLEKNEKVVTWLRDEAGLQIPCIFYNDKYYSLSLRMQKAIYRHIRLKKGFQNEEVLDGYAKLRIPDILLKEKIRTQGRFDVSTPHHAFPV